MVAPNREIANINSFTIPSTMSNPADSKGVSEDIQMGAPRGRSAIASANSSRESSVLSKASSIEYSARMEAQSVDPNWANQTEDKLFQLSYATPKGGESNIQVPANNIDSMPLPHVSNANSTCPQAPAISGVSSLPYAELRPGNPESWDGHTNPISMFGQNNTQEIDVNNSLMRISDFIGNRELKNNREKDIPFLSGFGQIAFGFVSSVFKGGWDQLKTDRDNKMFRELIKDEFTTKVPTLSKGKKANKFPPTKLVKFTKLPPPQLSPRPSKEVLEKSKFHGRNAPGKEKKTTEIAKLSYVQVSSKSVNNILKIKENFPELSNKKIKELNRLIFNKSEKPKPKINMMTKGPSRKQVITPMGSDNTKSFMTTSSNHVTNLNHALKGIKSDLIIDFICINY